jgi:hypothetical protein
MRTERFIGLADSEFAVLRFSLRILRILPIFCDTGIEAKKAKHAPSQVEDHSQPPLAASFQDRPGIFFLRDAKLAIGNLDSAIDNLLG